MAFAPILRQTRRRLILSLDGKPFTGKTHFMLTAPRPLKVFNIDFGLEGVVEGMADAGWDFDGVEVEDYTLEKAPVTNAHAIESARQLIAKFRASWASTLKRTERQTIGLDTGSEFWQLFRLAALGKLEQVPPMRYVQVNRIFRDLLNQVYQTPHSLVIVHRVKDRYDTKITDEGKEVSSRVPGEVERDGFKEIDGIVQVSLDTWRTPTKRGATYGLTVGKCRQRPSLSGTSYQGDLATFSSLALDVFPDSAPSDWE